MTDPSGPLLRDAVPLRREIIRLTEEVGRLRLLLSRWCSCGVCYAAAFNEPAHGAAFHCPGPPTGETMGHCRRPEWTPEGMKKCAPCRERSDLQTRLDTLERVDVLAARPALRPFQGVRERVDKESQGKESSE